MYICDGAIRWWCEWAVMCTATAPAKVGIIISLTLNKWPSRERETEVDNENGMKAGRWGERSPRLQTGHRNFHITHLCAIFKLTIVNFFLLLCRFLFFYAKRRNKTRESKKKWQLDRLPFKEHFFLFFWFFRHPGNSANEWQRLYSNCLLKVRKQIIFQVLLPSTGNC